MDEDLEQDPVKLKRHIRELKKHRDARRDSCYVSIREDLLFMAGGICFAGLQSSKQRPTHSKAWLIANRIAPKEVEQWTALSKEHTKVAKEVIRCTSGGCMSMCSC
jgi:hypothetical protein